RFHCWRSPPPIPTPYRRCVPAWGLAPPSACRRWSDATATGGYYAAAARQCLSARSRLVVIGGADSGPVADGSHLGLPALAAPPASAAGAGPAATNDHRQTGQRTVRRR